MKNCEFVNIQWRNW